MGVMKKHDLTNKNTTTKPPQFIFTLPQPSCCHHPALLPGHGVPPWDLLPPSAESAELVYPLFPPLLFISRGTGVFWSWLAGDNTSFINNTPPTLCPVFQLNSPSPLFLSFSALLPLSRHFHFPNTTHKCDHFWWSELGLFDETMSFLCPSPLISIGLVCSPIDFFFFFFISLELICLFVLFFQK